MRGIRSHVHIRVGSIAGDLRPTFGEGRRTRAGTFEILLVRQHIGSETRRGERTLHPGTVAAGAAVGPQIYFVARLLRQRGERVEGIRHRYRGHTVEIIGIGHQHQLIVTTAHMRSPTDRSRTAGDVGKNKVGGHEAGDRVTNHKADVGTDASHRTRRQGRRQIIRSGTVRVQGLRRHAVRVEI